MAASVLHFDPPAPPQATAETLSVRFAAACRIHARRIAVTDGERQVTYSELERMSARIAAGLRERGLPPGGLVGILTGRSAAMVAAMLGVLRAGGTYLPLDPGFPDARVRETLTDAGAFTCIVDAPNRHRCAGTGHLTMEALLSQDASAHVDAQVESGAAAYVIYTSGSTGKPKGVVVSHRNVGRLLDATAGWFGFDENDVWTMFHSFAFDFSVWEMWGALLTGARLVLVPYTASRAPDEFRALLAREGVTVLNQTPTAFNLLMAADARVPASGLRLRYVIFGGEALNLRALRPWIARHGDVPRSSASPADPNGQGQAGPALINMYGITETTVHVTYRRIRREDAEREIGSLIGVPIPDLQMHLLDASLRPVADGDTGEICIGGAGVALGYLHRPELTAERFVPDPFSAEPGARLYRSGDLACRRADGELMYLGRADRQVKISGFRIEPGEVEAALLAQPEVVQACVVAHGDAAGTQRLAAYVVTAGNALDPATLRNAVAARLPAHMRPSFYTQLAALPMNGNGKIDTAALPLPAAAGGPQPEVSPRTAHRGSGSEISDPEFGDADRSGWTPTERQVATVWRQVLATGSVSKTENFFDAGGTSLLLIALRDRLQQQLGRTIPVTWMFEHTTIEALAARLQQPEQTAPAQAAATLSRAEQQRNAFTRMKSQRAAHVSGGAR